MYDQLNQKPESKFHRQPAVPRRISEIEPDKDIRVRLLGKVVDTTAAGVVLDDGTRTEIFADIELMQGLKVGDVIRVFCRVLPLESGYELRAEMMQDFSALDSALYEKAKEILEKK